MESCFPTPVLLLDYLSGGLSGRQLVRELVSNLHTTVLIVFKCKKVTNNADRICNSSSDGEVWRRPKPRCICLPLKLSYGRIWECISPRGDTCYLWECLPMIEWLLLKLETLKEERGIGDRIRLSANDAWNKIQKYYQATDLSPYYVATIVLNPAYK